VDVRAVTAWSLLGTYDWCLVTRVNDHYESGVFDVRSPKPRPTAIAQMLRGLAAGREPNHPLLDVPGWWRRPERLYPPVSCCPNNSALAANPKSQSKIPNPSVSRVAGRPERESVCPVCDPGPLPSVTRQEMDITNPISVNRC